MKIALYLVLLLLFWIVFYFYFKGSKGSFTDRLSENNAWIKSNLDAMFFQLNDKTVRRSVVFLMLFAGIVGFFLPGKFSEIDKISSIEKAINLNKKGNYEEVATILQEIKNLDSPIVHNELGVAYLGMRNYNLAEKEFKKAIKILPNYSKAHYNLAAVYSRRGMNMDAKYEITKVKDASKYSISQNELYRLSGDIWNNMILRLLLACLLAYFGYKVPWAVIKFLKRRRIKKYDEQLADGLIMVSNSLRAGLSLVQALEIVSKEAKPPLSQEFETLLKEHRLGYNMEEALRHVFERMPTLDTKIFVNATLILRETGGNLTELFDTMASTIQERKRVQKKIRTMTAEGEAQVVILAILPIALSFILDKLNPEIFELMYTTFLGWVMIVIMALMEGVGLYWMLKIVRVKI